MDEINFCPACGHKINNIQKDLTTVSIRVDKDTREWILKQGSNDFLKSLINIYKKELQTKNDEKVIKENAKQYVEGGGKIKGIKSAVLHSIYEDIKD